VTTKFALGVIAGVVSAASLAAQEPWTGVSVQVKMPLEAKTLKGAPYSAETVSDRTQVLADGNRIVQHSTGRVYRDAEGRVRREEDRPSGGARVSITDPVAGVSWSLDPETHVAFRTSSVVNTTILNKVEAAKVEVARAAAAGAESRREGGDVAVFGPAGGLVELRRRGGATEQRTADVLTARPIEGVMAEGKRTTVTIPAGAIGNVQPLVTTTEEWTSPELQVLVFTDHKDPREGQSTYRLVNITRGDPPASLFQVPADYTIRETGIRRFERQ